MDTEIDFEELAKTIDSLALHAAYGSAVLAAHILERNLVSLLATRSIRKRASTFSLFDEDLDGLRKLTLGRLIEEVIAKFHISEGLEEELDNMLYFRNRLVHNISDDMLLWAVKPGWKDRVILELREIKHYFHETNCEIEKILDDWLLSNGLSREKLQELAKLIWRGVQEDVVPPR